MNGKMIFNALVTLVRDAEQVKVGDKNLVKFRGAWNEKRKGEQISSFATFESWSDYKNELILKFFKKGKNVAVRGSMIEDEYQDKEGNKVRSFKFRVDDFDLLDNRNDESEGLGI